MLGTETLHFKFTKPKLPVRVSFHERAAIFILRHLNGGSGAEVKGFRWWWESIMGAYVCRQIDVHWFPLPFLHVWNPWKFMECILEIGNPNSMEFMDLETETGIWTPMISVEFMTSMEYHWNSMEFHWIVWASMAFHRIPWTTMGFFGIPWSSIACHDIFWITLGYSWNFMDSMEVHGFHVIP